MFRVLMLSIALCASACAPAPVAMRATDASELLARFAQGAAPADVCTPGGRALLRGAVRAYGAEMQRAGVVWPAVPVRGGDAAGFNSIDISVLVAFSAGFVEASDFQGHARAMVNRLSFAQWPEITGMRQAAHVACSEVVGLQQTASRFVLEAERYQLLMQRAADGAGPHLAQRVRSQERLMERARTRMEDSAAAVEARVREAQS